MPPIDVDAFRAGLRHVSARPGHVDRLLRLAVRAGCALLAWQVETNGVAVLPRGGAGRGRPGAGCVIAVSPHRAWIDPFLLIAAWPEGAARLAWFGDGPTMVRSWWRRRLFPRLGMIPITPGMGGPRAYADLAEDVLRVGAALVVFPEKGPPSVPSETRIIAPGFAYLALRAGAPVVPVVLGGTHRIGRGSPFTVDVLKAIPVGSPIADPFSPLGRDRARAIVDRYRSMVDPVLRARTALADARRPARDRWTWLATLFH